MTAEQVTAHFATFDNAKRDTLEAIRNLVLEIVPEAEQVFKYNMPTFTRNGKAFAGCDAFKAHIGFFPHSGSITKMIADELKIKGIKFSDGGIQLPIDPNIDKALIRKVIALRLQEIEERGR